MLFSLYALFAVKGAALGLTRGVGGRTADIHAGGHALVILIIGTVGNITLDVGFGMGHGIAGDYVAVVFTSLGKAVAAGVVFGVGGGAVHLNTLANTQIILVVGAVAGVTSQITHNRKPSFPAIEYGCFSLLFCPQCR